MNNVSKFIIVAISQLKYGQTCFPCDFHNIRIILNNVSENESEIDSIDHIFFGFRGFNNETDILLQRQFSDEVNTVYLLSPNKRIVFSNLIDFVNKLKIHF